MQKYTLIYFGMNRIILLILVFCYLSSTGQTSLRNGLEAYWKFENNVNDETGNNYDGTNNGATYTASGKQGGAYDYDGTNDYVDISSSVIPNTGNPITILCWLNLDGQTEVGYIINDYSRTTVTGWALEVTTDEQIHAYNINNSSGHRRDRYCSALSTGTWYHVAAIIYPDATFPDIYINGSLNHAGTLTNGTPAQIYEGEGNVIIGRQSQYSTPQRYLDGTIDELKIYNRALSATEIKMDYNNGNGILYP